MAQSQMPQAKQPTAQPAMQQNKPLGAQTQPAMQTESVEKKSVFKKWWFWLIIVIILAAIGAGVYYFLPA